MTVVCEQAVCEQAENTDKPEDAEEPEGAKRDEYKGWAFGRAPVSRAKQPEDAKRNE